MAQAWTALDQERADSLARALVAASVNLRADCPDAHPDAFVVGVAQLLSELLQRRLAEEPTQLLAYAQLLQRLVDTVIPTTRPRPASRH